LNIEEAAKAPSQREGGRNSFIFEEITHSINIVNDGFIKKDIQN